MSIVEKYRHNYTYPGHALVIATVIMEKYPSFAEVRNGEKYGFPEALGDDDIPGAGGCVYSALDVLAKEDVEEAIALADYFWRGACSGCYADRYNKGAEEAKDLEPLFREMRTKWR